MLMLRRRSAAQVARSFQWAAVQGAARTPTRQSCRFLIDCSKVHVRRDTYGGAGAFAAVAIKKGELVESGIVRRLPVDGNVCPYVFTWSEDRSVWASGSGCSVFYNASLDGTENTEMKRYFDEDRFEIFAIRDIAVGDEVTHLYKSIAWRECFKELKELVRAAQLNPTPTKVLPAGSAPGMDSSACLVDCSKVYAKRDAYGGVGAFASVAIKKGELVERGIVRRLPVDGNFCPYVFTWSEDKSVWASGSGCSVFYNADIDGNENTEMKRYFDEDRFEIYAIRDIAPHEEVTHLYKSIEWRECFRDLKALKAQRDRLASDSKGFDTSARSQFTEYWSQDHAAPTLQNMMLDSDASSMDTFERPEIMAELPSLRGKRVLELGAGIGRFSGLIAQKADSVVAVDFVQSSCEENQRANADKPNLQVVQADATLLNLEPNSFDLVFSNWLLMYFTDEEVHTFAKKVLTWLKPGGHLFFRESCFHASGNAARRFNPTQYRDPAAYSQIFSDTVLEDGSRFQLLATNCVESYAQIKGNMHQMWFRWQKLDPLASRRSKRILETGQYSPAKCLRYEQIYGRGYIYTGGDVISKRMMEACKDLLVPGARCLDVGAGLAGTALYVAEHCPGVYIHGVNWSSELASLAAGRHVQRPPLLRQHISFELTPECGIVESEMKYPPNSFDVVFLRETLMYLEAADKVLLLQKICRVLRPGGRLVMIDYCSGQTTQEVGRDFQKHLECWNYFLMEIPGLTSLLERYFKVEEAENLTESFVGFMEQGLEKIEECFGPKSASRKGPLQSLTETELEDLRIRVKQSLGSVPTEVAEDAADAAVEKVLLHVAKAEADAESCQMDYAWAKDVWQLERRAAETGALQWAFFVATKTEAKL
mmetsp:Transcript_52875/g.113325  ORF Transcript_52875/g.113325 Transcript_52875/m.113325 type:complete len:878 (-) Transcript_52875:174-2807(-)